MNSYGSSSSSNNSETSSSDSDQDFERYFLGSKRHCIRNYFEGTVHEYTNSEFKSHFRINRKLFSQIVKMYSESEDYIKIADHYNVIYAEKHVAVFLWFAYRDIANRFNLSLWIVHHIKTNVVY